MANDIEKEIGMLKDEIKRLGGPPPAGVEGVASVKFGILVKDDRCANIFEALVGTLRAAKKRKVITYAGEMLLQGAHDDVDVVLLQD
ncbi:hypothetical protein PLICRDRAFT_166123 [Plicaturopsis crispa FD-325 SS-3]|nr:hypothetical protein PLICRDRAFT_166123 [Plicaturopsis crispa FD-325 SS-3]